MKFSTRARYGARLMVRLGLNYGRGPLMLKDIAREEGISEKYLSQIVLPLKAAGLVNSFRGAKGGYSLSTSPGDISMLNIIGILEGDLEVVGCVKDPVNCLNTSMCVTYGLWEMVSRKIAETLGSVMLSDLVEQYKQKKTGALTYNI